MPRLQTEIWRSFPTTQRCSSCTHRLKLPLGERVHQCAVCDLTLGRDMSATFNLLLEDLRLMHSLGPEQTEVTLVETAAAAQKMLDFFVSLLYICASRIAEAGAPHFNEG
ncbi:MAG: zinc ribbon domain-containing protein [Candidatus Heimdallarchaeota archaeon]